jgi:hypothetical protein
VSPWVVVRIVVNHEPRSVRKLLACHCLSAQAHPASKQRSHLLSHGVGFNTVQTPSSSLTIKIAAIVANIEQGGRLRRLLSQLPSRDQIVEDATDGRPFSSDVALCAIVLDQF